MWDDNRLNLSLSLPNEGQSGGCMVKNAEEGCSGEKRKFTFDEIENDQKRQLTEALVDNSLEKRMAPHTVKFVAPSAVLMDLPAEQGFRKELEKEGEILRKELEKERETFRKELEEQDRFQKELEKEQETFRKESEKKLEIVQKKLDEQERLWKELEERETFRKESEKEQERFWKELDDIRCRKVEMQVKEQKLVKERETILADTEDCKKKLLAASTDIEWLVQKGISSTIRRFLRSREFIEAHCIVNSACVDYGVQNGCKLMR